MNKLFTALCLASAATACQQAARTNPPAAVVQQASVAVLPEPAPARPDSLTTALLARFDLHKLLQTTHPVREGEPVQPMNGFFGTDHYRIEVVITSVQRDPQQPGRYLVRGLDRFKKRIAPFAGAITLSKVQAVPCPAGIMSEGWSYYAALGTYELREEESQPGAGVFQGRIAVDIGTKTGKELFPYAQSENTPSKGGSILYDGTWTGPTGQRKPAMWMANILGYAGQQVLNNFVIGERDRDVNPKYARLGWNSYWENEEWWSPTPRPLAQVQQERPAAFEPPDMSREKSDIVPTDTVAE